MKNILFLEDNIAGIGRFILELKLAGHNCLQASNLADFSRLNEDIDLYVLDDNIYGEENLNDVGYPDIPTNNGSNTGAILAKLLREEGKLYSKSPIIIYSVHDSELIRKNIGNIQDVFIFDKLRGESIYIEALEKCKELLNDNDVGNDK